MDGPTSIPAELKQGASMNERLPSVLPPSRLLRRE